MEDGSRRSEGLVKILSQIKKCTFNLAPIATASFFVFVEGNWVGKNKKDRVKSGTGFEKKRTGVAPFLHEANEHLCNCGIDLRLRQRRIHPSGIGEQKISS